MVGYLTNIYCPTVGHLIENLLKKSNALPMPDPPPLWGLTLIGNILNTDEELCALSLFTFSLQPNVEAGKLQN
jgi:hypothetical protein